MWQGVVVHGGAAGLWEAGVVSRRVGVWVAFECSRGVPCRPVIGVAASVAGFQHGLLRTQGYTVTLRSAQLLVVLCSVCDASGCGGHDHKQHADCQGPTCSEQEVHSHVGVF
jgi:hypothetical protein